MMFMGVMAVRITACVFAGFSALSIEIIHGQYHITSEQRAVERAECRSAKYI